MKRNRWIALSAKTLALFLLLTCLIPDAAGAASSALKKSAKKAEKAWQGGQLDEAAKLYESVLAAAAPGDAERAQALFALALYYLQPYATTRDEARARTLLEELAAAFPISEHRLEARALTALLSDTSALDRCTTELAAAREGAAAAGEQTKAAAAQAESTRAKLAAAEKDLGRVRAELVKSQEELAKKGQALEELKRRMVRRGGG